MVQKGKELRTYARNIWLRTTEFVMVTRGDGVILVVNHAPNDMGVASASPIVLCFPGQLSQLPYSFWR